MITEENVSTKLSGPNDPAKMLAIIGSHFRFIYYDLDQPAMDEIYEAAHQADIIVASDCHGDETALMVPIETAEHVGATLIYLGDYFAYEPDYILWRAPSDVRTVVEREINEVNARINKILEAESSNGIFLFGNHDMMSSVKLRFSARINDMVFQHSFTLKHPQCDVTPFTTVDHAMTEFMTNMTDEIEVPEYGVMVLGHLPDYSALGLPNVLSVDGSNSRVMQKYRRLIRHLKADHARMTIPTIKATLDEYQHKLTIVKLKIAALKANDKLPTEVKLSKATRHQQEVNRLESLINQQTDILTRCYGYIDADCQKRM